MLDKKYAVELLAGNEELYIELLEMFYEEYSGFNVVDLEEEEIFVALHTLKGLSLNIGAKKLSEIAQFMEKNRDKSKMQELFGELESVMNDIKMELENAGVQKDR